MGHYLLIESGAGLAPMAPWPAAELAADLAATGHAVTVFLVQNGVFAARRGARYEAAAPGVTFLADDFSLRERGIGADQLAPGVSVSPLETVVDALAAGHRVIWQ